VASDLAVDDGGTAGVVDVNANVASGMAVDRAPVADVPPVEAVGMTAVAERVVAAVTEAETEAVTVARSGFNVLDGQEEGRDPEGSDP